MFTSWTCGSCDASNEMGGDEFCSECGKSQSCFSPIGVILDDQQLLFDGYIRTEIIGYLPKAVSYKDVINECNNFFNLPIISLMEECKQELLNDEYFGSHYEWLNDEEYINGAQFRCIKELCHNLKCNEEYWHNYMLLKMLLQYEDDESEISHLYGELSLLLALWHKHDESAIIKEYEQLIEANPTSVMLKVTFGSCFRRQKQYTKAIDKYLYAMEFCGDIKDKIYCFGVMAGCFRYTKFAMRDMEQSQKEKVHKIINELDSDDYDIKLRSEYADSLFDMKQYQLALNKYFKLLPLETKDFERYRYSTKIAYCCRRLGDYKNAEKFHKQAFKLDPTNELNLCATARFYRDCMKDYKSAAIFYQKVIETVEDDDIEYGKKYCYEYGNFLRDYTKDYKEAEIYYIKSLEFDPEDLVANGSYAYLLYLIGDYEKAMEYMKVGVHNDKWYVTGCTEETGTYNWINFYGIPLNEAMGKYDVVEKGIMKVVELIREGDDGWADDYQDNIFTHLALMKSNDTSDRKCYDTLKDMLISEWMS